MRRIRITISACVGSTFLCSGAPIESVIAKAIEPSQIVALREVSDAQISPAGDAVLFVVRAKQEAAEDVSTIWSVSTDGGVARPYVSGAGHDEHPRWSPDGTKMAFLSGRADSRKAQLQMPCEIDGCSRSLEPDSSVTAESRAIQIWVSSNHGGEALPLTSMPGDVTFFQWSPGGERIAFISKDPETRQDRADRQRGRDAIEVGRDGRPARLYVYDLETKAVRCISPPDKVAIAAAWAPDGNTLAVRLAPTTSINDFYFHARIVLVDAADGAIRDTIPRPIASDPQMPTWSPDGRRIAFNELMPGGIGAEPRLFDVRHGTVVDLVPGSTALVTKMQWAPDSRSLVALAFHATRTRLIRIDVTTRGARDLVPFDGEAAELTSSRDGKRLVIVGGTPARASDVWLVEGKRLRPITDLNPQVRQWTLGAVEEISWTNSIDHQRIYGVLVTPPGYKGEKRLRTVVQVHGGPEWAWWSGWLASWHDWAQMLASRGYAVLLPNPRGSDGQGTAFARAVADQWGEQDFQDIMDGVDMLIARGIADPDRLGIGGWSYGGYMSSWAITHTNRFKAAVVGAAVTDLFSFATTTDTPDFPRGYFGDVSVKTDRYDRQSPARYLRRVSTPALVLHGEEDTRVSPDQGEQLFVGLRMLGKEVEMVRYPREPHWIREQGHMQDIMERVASWYDRYLGTD